MPTVPPRVLRLLKKGLEQVLHPRRPASTPSPRDGSGPATLEAPAYPGDFDGPVSIVYDPHPDGEPDPGEIVWAWVPYEEDHTRGKDRPVLLIGHDGPWLLALQLTSKDRDRNAAHELRQGRIWIDIGSGAWDHRGRPSEARVNRILRIAPDAIRREGAVLDEAVFTEVAAAVEAALS
ncbi:MAG: type II toxin-antitoxin system PemK/MazF family toxin [Intrasporangiaceae bacterium]|nr:type II toxin-antitoxin system PemK/MazF family toxin [Intrasporangiaceae bacterium]